MSEFLTLICDGFEIVLDEFIHLSQQICVVVEVGLFADS